MPSLYINYRARATTISHYYVNASVKIKSIQKIILQKKINSLCYVFSLILQAFAISDSDDYSFVRRLITYLFIFILFYIYSKIKFF